jgi:hypothetical protein
MQLLQIHRYVAAPQQNLTFLTLFTTEIYVRWNVNETTFALFEQKTADKKISLK